VGSALVADITALLAGSMISAPRIDVLTFTTGVAACVSINLLVRSALVLTLDSLLVIVVDWIFTLARVLLARHGTPPIASSQSACRHSGRA
jgi:hypothetical protein